MATIALDNFHRVVDYLCFFPYHHNVHLISKSDFNYILPLKI
jgi:hypothetical protein